MEVEEIVKNVEDSFNDKNCEHISLIKTKDDDLVNLISLSYIIDSFQGKGYECKIEEESNSGNRGGKRYYKLTIINNLN